MDDSVLIRLVELTPDAILVADREGVIVYWNRAASRIFGFITEEAIGSTLDIIIPEQMRERHWKGYRRVMAEGKTAYGERLLNVPGVTRSGKRVSLEFSVVLIPGEATLPCWCGAVVRDVTERWEKRGEKDRVSRGN